MSLRYPIVLGALAALLAIGVGAALATATELGLRIQEAYNRGFTTDAEWEAAMDGIATLQQLQTALLGVAPFLVIAATIPLTGALALLVLRARRGDQRASDSSATASREA